MGGWTASKSRLVINAAAELQQMAFKIDFACMNTGSPSSRLEKARNLGRKLRMVSYPVS